MDGFSVNVKKIIFDELGVDVSRIGYEDIGSDYVVWKKTGTVGVGGLRLVIAKDGKYFFKIPSYYSANREGGISWDYEVIIEGAPATHLSKLSKILEEHINESPIKIYRALASGLPISLGVYFIQKPLILTNQFLKFGVKGVLQRPNGLGSYEF